jgi:vitamin K-dependent gamma-carboxylase
LNSSIDALSNKSEAKVPFWNYFLIKFQFFVLYFIAGCKKFSTEWLLEWQHSISNLSSNWIFTPFRFVIGSEWTDQIMIHWFAAVFDTSITFFLIYKKSRPMALLFCSTFHIMNSRLFNIGMFPWVCLVELPLFCEYEWPRRFWRKLKCSTASSTERTIANDKNVTTKRTLKERFTTFLILIYCCLQLFLPFSHFITKGYINSSFVLTLNIF